jgi:hypothetical protein
VHNSDNYITEDQEEELKNLVKSGKISGLTESINYVDFFSEHLLNFYISKVPERDVFVYFRMPEKIIGKSYLMNPLTKSVKRI